LESLQTEKGDFFSSFGFAYILSRKVKPEEINDLGDVYKIRDSRKSEYFTDFSHLPQIIQELREIARGKEQEVKLNPPIEKIKPNPPANQKPINHPPRNINHSQPKLPPPESRHLCEGCKMDCRTSRIDERGRLLVKTSRIGIG